MRESKRERGADGVPDDDGNDGDAGSGLLGHRPHDAEHHARVRERDDPQRRIACQPLGRGAERPRTVLLERVLERVSATAGDPGALDDEQHEYDDADVDPPSFPVPDLARHVRARAEEANDGDREHALCLPGERRPRGGVGDGLGAT